MRQATGSSAPQRINKVSIQQSLDGHSFSVPTFDEAAASKEPVQVEVLSKRTMLVPREAFDPATVRTMLALNGTPAAEDDTVVWSDTHAPLIAVMALSAEAYTAVDAALGARARYTTPLLTTPALASMTVWMALHGGLLYIKVYSERLEMAEVVAMADTADAEYLAERLAAEFDLAQLTLQLAGGETGSLRKVFRKRFKKTVLCE